MKSEEKLNKAGTLIHYSNLQGLVRGTLEVELCVRCVNCENFDESDNYCKLLQINFLPDGFGCNKGVGEYEWSELHMRDGDADSKM